jgi:hypothetical protein
VIASIAARWVLFPRFFWGGRRPQSSIRGPEAIPRVQLHRCSSTPKVIKQPPPPYQPWRSDPFAPISRPAAPFFSFCSSPQTRVQAPPTLGTRQPIRGRQKCLRLFPGFSTPPIGNLYKEFCAGGICWCFVVEILASCRELLSATASQSNRSEHLRVAVFWGDSRFLRFRFRFGFLFSSSLPVL